MLCAEFFVLSAGHEERILNWEASSQLSQSSQQLTCKPRQMDVHDLTVIVACTDPNAVLVTQLGRASPSQFIAFASDDAPSTLSMSPDGDYFAVGSSQGWLRLFKKVGRDRDIQGACHSHSIQCIMTCHHHSTILSTFQS